MCSFRIDDELWDAAMTAARGRDDTLSQVIRRSLKEYINTPKRQKLVIDSATTYVGDDVGTLPQRSVRIDAETWAAAMTRASAEGLNLSIVIRHFLKTYVAESPKPKRRRK
jgi:antitoxin component of RelBE/YafQ-DinJ toxin-antitoxin module